MGVPSNHPFIEGFSFNRFWESQWRKPPGWVCSCKGTWEHPTRLKCNTTWILLCHAWVAQKWLWNGTWDCPRIRMGMCAINGKHHENSQGGVPHFQANIEMLRRLRFPPRPTSSAKRVTWDAQKDMLPKHAKSPSPGSLLVTGLTSNLGSWNGHWFDWT